MILKQPSPVDTFQRPEISLIDRPIHILGFCQFLVVAESIAGQAMQHAIGLHRIDMNKLRPFPMPIPVF